MGNVSLMVMSMAVAGKGSSFLGEGSNFMDIFINFLSMIWDAVGDTLMSVVYFIVKFMLNIVDFLQFFVGKLVGINVWMDGTDVTQLELQDLDIIFRFLYSSEVQRVFKALIIIGAVLLIIFTIIAVVQSEYKTAQGDDDAFKKGKAFVLKRALTAVTLMIFVPIMTIVGILASNAVLASLTKTLNANTTLTFGGQIFVASSYDASRYRYYAMTGSRIPVTYPNAIEVVNPSKTGSGSSYYLVDANGNLNYWTGSLKNMEGELADVAYNTWEYNKKYKDFVTNWDNSYTLANVSWESAEGDGATYSAFVVDNAADYKKEYDFSYIDTTGDYINGSTNNVYTKTYSTGNTAYATYAPIPAEYMVVADFIDYAIEYSQKVYIVNVTNESIDWSNVPTRYYKIIQNDGIREAVEIAVDYREGLYSDVSGRVIYRGNNNANSETQGAQYIYATLEKGKYVPILANQTNSGVAFTSSYLADGYEGVVIARGVFDTNGNPTEIYQVSTDGMEFTDPKYVLANADADSTVEAYVSRIDYNYKQKTINGTDIYYLGIVVTYEVDGEPGGTAWYGFNSYTAFNSDPTMAMDILSKNSSILSYQTYYEGNILKVKVYDKSRNLTFVLPSNYFSAVPGNGTELESLSFQNMNIGERASIEKNGAYYEGLTTERYAIDLNFYNINGSKLDNKTRTLSYTFDNQMNMVDFTNIENVTIGNTNYIRFKLSDDYSLLLDDATGLIFMSATLAGPEKAVDYLNALFNPEYLYEFNYITTSYTALPLKEAQKNNGDFTYYVYNVFAPGQIEEAWYSIDFDAIPKADYVISFRRNDIKWGIGFDININGIKFSTWRFHLGLTYDINETSVATLPVDSGMILNYNFSSSNGLLMENLFKPSRINPIVLVFATVLIFKILGDAVWGMIKRIFDIVIHFIVMPGFVSTIALDDGARFSKWKEGLIKAIFGAYGVILGLNFFFILVPILKDATQIFTAGDLPSSLQGSFVGNSIFANPDVLNNIVYILFLLVAFTLIKSMPSMIAEWLGVNEYVKEGSKVRGDVKENNKAVASFVSGNDAKAAAKNFVSTVTGFLPGSAFYGDKMKKVFGKMKNRAGETFDGMVESFRSRHAGGEGGASAEGRESRSWFRRRTAEEKLAAKEEESKAVEARIDELSSRDFTSLTKDEQKELAKLNKDAAKINAAKEKYEFQIDLKKQKEHEKQIEEEAKKTENIARKTEFENSAKELTESYRKAMENSDTEMMNQIEDQLKAMYKDYSHKNGEFTRDKHYMDNMINSIRAANFNEQFDALMQEGKFDDAEKLYQNFAENNGFNDKRFNKYLKQSVKDRRLKNAQAYKEKAQNAFNQSGSEEDRRRLQEADDILTQAQYMHDTRLSDSTLRRIREGKDTRGLRKMKKAHQSMLVKALYGADINRVARGELGKAETEASIAKAVKEGRMSKTDKKALSKQLKRASKVSSNAKRVGETASSLGETRAQLQANAEARQLQTARIGVMRKMAETTGLKYSVKTHKAGDISIGKNEFAEFIGKGSFLNMGYFKRKAMRKLFDDKSLGQQMMGEALKDRRFNKAVDDAVKVRAKEKTQKTQLDRATKDAGNAVGWKNVSSRYLDDLKGSTQKIKALRRVLKDESASAETKTKAEKQLNQLLQKKETLKKIAQKHGVEDFNLKGNKRKELKKAVEDVARETQSKLNAITKEYKKTTDKLTKTQKELKDLSRKERDRIMRENKKRYSAVKDKKKEDSSAETSAGGNAAPGNAAQRRDTGGAGNAGMK